MSIDRESKFKFYSFGIVAKDKERTSNTITVTPIEHLSLIDGKLTAPIENVKTSLPDINGEKTPLEGSVEKVIEAIWIPFGHSNRSTSPDVIAGETILLFTFAEDNTIYWTTFLDEPAIRRLETVRYSYGNLRSGRVKYDKTTSYWTEYSTHDKYIWTKTSNSDGEKFVYDFKIDTGNSTVSLNDDVGNKFVIESNDTRITIQNAMGTSYIQEETRITEHADESIFITTAEHSTTTDVSITTDTSVATHSASTSYNINSPLIGINASVALTMEGSGIGIKAEGEATISATKTTAQGLFSFTQGGGRNIEDITLEVDRLWEAIHSLR